MSGTPQIALPPMDRALLALAGVWSALLLVDVFVQGWGGGGLSGWLALDTHRVLRGEVWRVVSYAFVHSTDGFGHLLFNLVALWIFGGPVVAHFGRRRGMELLGVGVLAGALAVLLAALVGSWLGRSAAVVVGASAGINALLAAFCLWHWRRKLSLFVTQLEGRHLLVLVIGVDVFRWLAGSPVSLAAHFGGLAAGLWWQSPTHRPPVLLLRLKAWRLRRKLRVVEGGSNGDAIH